MKKKITYSLSFPAAQTKYLCACCIGPNVPKTGKLPEELDLEYYVTIEMQVNVNNRVLYWLWVIRRRNIPVLTLED